MIDTKVLGRYMVRGTPQGLFLTLYKNITFVMPLVRVTGFDGWLCQGKAIWFQPVFELVAAKCHRHLAFKWVRIWYSKKKGITFVMPLVRVTGFEPAAS